MRTRVILMTQHALRLTVQGFVCIDHGASIMEGLGEIGGLLQEGKLKFNEDARDTGIENYVDSVNLYEAPSYF